MKKLLLLFVFLLAACGAPDEPAEVEPIVEKVVTVIVEVEKIVEVAAVPTDIPVSDCPLGWPQEWTDLGEQCPAEWDVLYFKVTEKTPLWYNTLTENEAGFPVFKILPESHRMICDVGDIVTVYNGNQATEYYRNLDGTIAIDGPSRANAEELELIDGEWVAKFPGRYRSDGGGHFYKVAGSGCEGVFNDGGAGFFFPADNGFLPFCEDLTLKIPESCTQ